MSNSKINVLKECGNCKIKTKAVWRYKDYFYCYKCYKAILKNTTETTQNQSYFLHEEMISNLGSSGSIEKRCKCCDRLIPKVHKQRKYCFNCGLYLKEIKRKLSHYKSKCNNLNKILYGQKNGAERIRLVEVKR